MFKKLKAGLNNALIWGAAWFGGSVLLLGAFVLLGLAQVLLGLASVRCEHAT